MIFLGISQLKTSILSLKVIVSLACGEGERFEQIRGCTPHYTTTDCA